MKEKDFYTIEEFANLLRLHPNSIRRGIKIGYFQAFRSGPGKCSRFRIPHSELTRVQEFSTMALIDKIVDEKLKEKKVK